MIRVVAWAVLAGATWLAFQIGAGHVERGRIAEPVVSHAMPHRLSTALRTPERSAMPGRTTETALLQSERPTSRDLGSLVCRVVDRTGARVGSGGITVRLRGEGHAAEARPVEGSGGARFAALPPGLYRLNVDGRTLPEGWLPVFVDHRVELKRGEDRTETLTVERTSALQGWLTDSTGAPLVNARVRLQPTTVDVPTPPATRSDGQGYYEFPHLRSADYRVVLVPPAGTGSAPSPRVASLMEGAPTRLDLRTHMEGGEIEGHLLDPQGSPAVGVAVHAEVDGSQPGTPFAWSRVVARTRTDEHGRFHLEGIPTGQITVIAAHARVDTRAFGGGSPWAARTIGSFEIAPSSVVDAGRLSLATREDAQAP